MHAYMQHLADQQAANHWGQMQLNDSFYQYTLHQHHQDPNPYPWPTLEQFKATIAWPRDRPNFLEEAGPTDAQGAATGTKVELRMMERWQICLISSLEEAELLDHDLLNL